MSIKQPTTRRRLRVVLLADDNAIHPSDPDCLLPHGELYDDTWQVAGAIRNLGYELTVMGFELPIQTFAEKIHALRPQVIFNFTESINGDRLGFPNITAMLDLLDIPYTGAGMTALAMTIDKALTKQVLAWHGVPVPDFFVVQQGCSPTMPARIQFPLFVKPLHGGGKEAISLAALAGNHKALQRRVEYIHSKWKQSAICEQYIDGRELTLAVTGNDQLTIFPPREMLFNTDNPKGPRILTQRVLENRSYRHQWNLKMVDADLTPAQHRRLQWVGRTAYRALGLRGYARFDIRMGRDDEFYIIEANANPALRRPAASVIAPWGGIEYEELIDHVIQLGLEYHRRRKRKGGVV